MIKRLGSVLVFCVTVLGLAQAKVHVTINGLNLQIGNDHFSAGFTKGIGGSLTVDGKNLAKEFHIDYTLKKIRKFTPSALKLVSKTDDLVHVYYQNHDTHGLLSFEQHFVVTNDVSGIYQYIVIQNFNKQEIDQAEIRMQWKMNNNILNQINNGLVDMIPPTEAVIKNSPNVWDSTWLIDNKTYYSKYDFARYVRETNYYGLMGHGYGAWVILPDHEYFSGGPLKQDLLSHQWGIILVYMMGSHFGTPTLKMKTNFEKLYGPWLMYFNKGTDDQIKADVQSQAQKEIAKWPYSFIIDSRYPLASGRGTVKGVINGKKAMVFLQPPGEACELQTEGYSYHAETVNQGFEIKNVRPGKYLMCAYPLEGAAVGTMLQKSLTVTAGQVTNAGTQAIQEPSGIIWQLGQVDHRSSEFKYSNEKRNWGFHLLPPKDLTFVIGQSNPANDWYYAQTNRGTWNIEFTDTKDNRNRAVWVGLAGASYTPSTIVTLNGHQLGNLDPPPTDHLMIRAPPAHHNSKKFSREIVLFLTGSYTNDAAIYRCALQSGNYHYVKLSIQASQVVTGTNTLSIHLSSGMLMYDTIVYLRT